MMVAAMTLGFHGRMHLHEVRINALQMEYEYNDLAIYMLKYKKIQ